MEPTKVQEYGGGPDKGTLGKVLIIIVLLLAVFLVVKFMGIGGDGLDIEYTKDNVTVEHNDTDSTPPGLPTNLPVEGNALAESIKTSYPDNNINLYSVAYTTDATKEAKYAEYESYMSSAGYDTSSTTKEERAAGVIKGADARGNSLMVIIGEQNGKTFVQIAYTEKLN